MKDWDRSDAAEYAELPSRPGVPGCCASGIRLTMEFSLYWRSTRIDLNSSISRPVIGFVPSWIFKILRIAPVDKSVSQIVPTTERRETYAP